MSELPPLYAGGHVLVVSQGYPPMPGGTVIIMRNLLECFDPSSFTVVAQRWNSPGIAGGGTNVIRLLHTFPKARGLNRLLWEAQMPWITARLVHLVRTKHVRAIVAVYPELLFVEAAWRAATLTRTPLLAYLHDTLGEANEGGRYARRAKKLQKRLFADAKLLVMSRGMSDLYRDRYGLEAEPLEHSYPEPILAEVPAAPSERQAFWGGAVYRINDRAVARVSEALAGASIPFLFATNTSREQLAKMKIAGDHVKTAFYGKRDEYLEVVRRQGLLVLALNAPDESDVHRDELATIFPTKTPEYLATGRPILVHCPEDYFLARFFREHGCGLVVSDRSVAKLREAIEALENDPSRREAMGRAALKAAAIFSRDRIANRFREAVARTVEGA